MSVKTPSKPETMGTTKGKLEKADSFLGVAYKLIAISGLAGTAFVWLASNFYTGELVVMPDKEPQFVEIKVYDTKGQATLYHTKSVSLMPGTYHVEVSANGGKSQHADIQIAYGKQSGVPLVVDDSLKTDNKDNRESEEGDGAEHKWWRFWR
jgi:outer membrane usher protein FimD/PapC